MIDADKTIEAIDKKIKEEEAKGTAKEYLLKLGFSFEEKNIPNAEKTKSEITDKKDNWPTLKGFHITSGGSFVIAISVNSWYNIYII